MKRETYRKLYARQAAFYKAHPRAMKALIFANFALTAAVFAAYALLCAFGLIGGSLADVLRIVGVPLLCLLTVSALRNLINRKRPYECADIRPLLHKNKSGRSFPSRHVASARRSDRRPVRLARLSLTFFRSPPAGSAFYFA